MDTFPLTDVFQFLGMQRKSGVLTIDGADGEAKIFFSNGNVVHASRTKTPPEHLLGKILVKAGLISPGDLIEALTIQRRRGGKLGEILVGKEMLDRKILDDVLRTQMTQIVYKLFSLREGNYNFIQGGEHENGFPPIPAEHLLMEGARLMDEWPVIMKTIRSGDMVFRIKETGSDGAAFALNDEQKRVLDNVDGRNTVSDIIYKTLLPEFEVCKILHTLVSGGIIEEDIEARNRSVFSVDFVGPFQQAVVNTLKNVCNMKVEVCKPRLKKPMAEASGDISAVMDLYGERKGVFVLTFEKQCALGIFNRMLGLSLSHVDEQVTDAVGELANIISGAGRRRLANMGFILSASIPTVVAGDGHTIGHKIEGPRIMAPFKTQYGEFGVEIGFQD